MQAAVDYAVKKIDRLSPPLRPAHRFYLAKRYNVEAWIPDAIRTLLATSLVCYTVEDVKHTGIEVYMEISRFKEHISDVRRQLAANAPFPTNFDNAPHCFNHDRCKRVWEQRWMFEIATKIHSPTTPFALTEVVDALEVVNHTGMNDGCKNFIMNWLKTSCKAITREERILVNAVESIRSLPFDPSA